MIMQKEQIKFTVEELHHIFDHIDNKHDEVIDKDEFLTSINNELHPLTYVQGVIRNNNLDIEDIAHKLGIDINNNIRLSLEEFTRIIKKLDYTMGNDFICAIFTKLKQNNCNYVESNTLLQELNMKHKDLNATTETTDSSFKKLPFIR